MRWVLLLSVPLALGPARRDTESNFHESTRACDGPSRVAMDRETSCFGPCPDKIVHEPEASRVPCFVQYAADRANTHTMKAAAYFYPDRDPDRDLVEPATMEAATAYLKKIGYPGEAG